MSVLQELQRHAVFAIVGLIAFFPIFNQVAETSQDALRDADHKAKFKDFIKSWDDIPEDEKLSYWDGKSKPPGQQGDIDEDRVDKDGKFHEPDPQPPPPDRDGDGVADQDDPDPDDPRVRDEESEDKARDETVELYRFTGTAEAVVRQDTGEEIRIEQAGEEGEEWVLQEAYVSWEVEGFSGTYSFRLRDESAQKWDMDSGNGQLPRADYENSGTSPPFRPASDMTMLYDYRPFAATSPDEFTVTVLAEYRVYSP